MNDEIRIGDVVRGRLFGPVCGPVIGFTIPRPGFPALPLVEGSTCGVSGAVRVGGDDA